MGRMISELFQTVLGLSLVGSYVILLVLLVRLVLRKAPKWCSYLLWGVVFIRLMCPVFPEAQFSLIPRQLSNNAIVAWLEGDATGFDNMQIETDLAADGESTVGDTHHIRRGYEDPVRDLCLLGAKAAWDDIVISTE